MVPSGGRLDDAISAEGVDEGRALSVFGVAEAQLALLVPAPGVNGPGFGDGKHVD